MIEKLESPAKEKRARQIAEAIYELLVNSHYFAVDSTRNVVEDGEGGWERLAPSDSGSITIAFAGGNCFTSKPKPPDTHPPQAQSPDSPDSP